MSKNQPTHEQINELFHSHVLIPAEPEACWTWQAAKNNIGYGFFRYQKRMQTAHRVQAQLMGWNVAGMLVLHSCNSYDCVNPKHLILGSHRTKADLCIKSGSQRVSKKKMARSVCKYCQVEHYNCIIARDHNERCKRKPVSAQSD